MEVRRIGLLFVHGMGEQKRWEHLRNTVRDFAELMRVEFSDYQVNVLDRTEGWKPDPSEPIIEGLAPISLTLKHYDKTIAFECHEVFWADLGARTGLAAEIGFWIWALGQWSAPIFLQSSSSASSNSILPESVAGYFWAEIWTRVRLVFAGLAAIFTLLSWTLAKRLFAKIFSTEASPTLILQYLGDVRLYERRAKPGEAVAADAGQPLRVPIRRRMVTQMVAMGLREEYEAWYVIAHSLGTVVAYNGLTETGHALPNYLSQAQWSAIPRELKIDDSCRRREPNTLPQMMPARPTWLDEKDVINRKELFKKLRGVLTYGSPLDKFAALWPRVVATADDRTNNATVFPNTEWLNVVAPHDPVAGRLDSFGYDKKVLGSGLTAPQNRSTKCAWRIGLAHIEYFRPAQRFARNKPEVSQRRKIMRWLTCEPECCKKIDEHSPGLGTFIFLIAGYAFIFCLLWAFTTGLFVAGTGILSSLLGTDRHSKLDFSSFWTSFGKMIFPTLGFVTAIVTLAGLARWTREMYLNQKLAKWDDLGIEIVLRLNTHRWFAIVVTAVAVPLIFCALIADLQPRLIAPLQNLSFSVPEGCHTAITGFASILVAILSQTLVNWIFKYRESTSTS